MGLFPLWFRVGEIQLIHFLQQWLRPLEPLFQAFCWVGKYDSIGGTLFPLILTTLGPFSGFRALWALAVADWLNAILKWIISDDRPYWFVAQHNLTDTYPLRQFGLATCETGPGMPSGHVMVIGIVLFLAMSDVLSHFHDLYPDMTKVGVEKFFIIGACIMGVSRMYMAAHFPTQTVAGFIIVLIIGPAINGITIAHEPQDDLRRHFIFSAIMLATGYGVHFVVHLFIDPEWSIKLAMQHCSTVSGMTLDTTPMNSIWRTAGTVLGVGITYDLILPRVRRLASRTLLLYSRDVGHHAALIIATICNILLANVFINYAHASGRIRPDMDVTPSHVMRYYAISFASKVVLPPLILSSKIIINYFFLLSNISRH